MEIIRKRDGKPQGGKGQDSGEGSTAKRARDGGSPVHIVLSFLPSLSFPLTFLEH